MTEGPFDVIVVGCGIAGLSAALTAAEGGCRVAILERAPPAESGGNTRYTESFWRMQGTDAVSADFEEKFGANSGGWPEPGILRDLVRSPDQQPAVLRALGIADPDLVATIASEAPKTLQWLTSFGIRFDFLPIYFLSQSTTRMAPVGGGLALIEALGQAVQARPDRITLFCETAARALLQDPTGGVTGIRAVARGNRPVEFRAGNVVLACGGFQGNPEMLSHYVGPQAQFVRPVARGGHYNRGEGIRMALQAGAAACGDYGSFHAQPADPRSADIEPVIMHYAYGILVNDSGRRFADEAPDMVDASYETVARSIMTQRNGIAWAVFDAGLDEIDNWTIAVRSRVAPQQSAEIDGIADAIGVGRHDLVATIEAFNAACPDSDGFDPLRPDGLATIGIEPAKSNWSRPLVRPPFRAWPVICTNCFTFGGVKIDSNARVINTEGDVIPGLYAAGEVVGLYYRNYVGATSVMRGAVTGRLAGADVANRKN